MLTHSLQIIIKGKDNNYLFNMAVQVTINDISGQTPFDIYICQSGGTGCFYISTITNANLPNYIFNIPAPYDTNTSYMLKVIDANNCIISGTTVI